MQEPASATPKDNFMFADSAKAVQKNSPTPTSTPFPRIPHVEDSGRRAQYKSLGNGSGRMRHVATESALVMAILVDLSRFMHVHHPIVSPFIVVQASIVGPVGDEWVLCPAVIVVRTTGQEIK